MELNKLLFLPQEQLNSEERKINIFIQKEIYGYEYIKEAHCNIDPESGIVEICYNKERKNYFSKYEETLLLPVYLCPNNCIKSEVFFNEIVYNSNVSEEDYKTQKENFLEKTISYDGWHISSFEIVPDYCNNNDIINEVINIAIEKKLISKESYLNKLKSENIIKNEFDLLLVSAYNKAKCLYLLINNSENIDEKNIICFFKNPKNK